MKDSLFELLLDLFEKTILQLKERYPLEVEKSSDTQDNASVEPLAEKKSIVQVALMQSASPNAFRVITAYERAKLSKASYQFLQQLVLWEVVPADLMELILNRLLFSEAPVVELQETKWTVRNTLATTLDEKQLAFLDLVLYQKEHGLALH
jgi:Smg protein